MRRSDRNFPFPPLPPGDVTPWPGPGDRQQLLERDIRIIRSFIEEREGRCLKWSPLAELLEVSAQLDLNAPSIPISAIPPARAHYHSHATFDLVRLAWAIRALCSRGALVQVDGSFITSELLGVDNDRPGAAMKLAGGVGTLTFAGRLVQAGGGRVWISGRKKAGYDIRWEPACRGQVLVERKNRAYQAGLNDGLKERALRVVEEVASSHIPIEPNTLRVLVIGFRTLVPATDSSMEAVEAAYAEALRGAFGENPSGDLPHVVVVEHLGLEPGGEKGNFSSPHLLKDDRSGLIERIGPLILRAIGFDI